MTVCLSSKRWWFQPFRKEISQIWKSDLFWNYGVKKCIHENRHLVLSLQNIYYNITSVPKRKHTLQIKKLSMLLRDHCWGTNPISTACWNVYHSCEPLQFVVQGCHRISTGATRQLSTVIKSHFKMYLLGSGTKTNGHIASHWSHVALDLFRVVTGTSFGPWNWYWTCVVKVLKVISSAKNWKICDSPGIQGFLSKNLRHSASKGIIGSLKYNAKFHLILPPLFHEKKTPRFCPGKKNTKSPKWPVGKKDVIRWVVLDCLGGQKNLIYQLSEKSWCIGPPQIM